MTARLALPLPLVALLLATAAAAPPATRKVPVTDTYHGVKVVDDYRWLEDGKGKAVKAWSDAQNEYARAYLGKLPVAAKIRPEVKKILSAKTISHFRLHYSGGQLFAMKGQPPGSSPSWW
jgi:prolyl oligopeptidase